jgi:hypothetical protein
MACNIFFETFAGSLLKLESLLLVPSEPLNESPAYKFLLHFILIMAPSFTINKTSVGGNFMDTCTLRLKMKQMHFIRGM